MQQNTTHNLQLYLHFLLGICISIFTSSFQIMVGIWVYLHYFNVINMSKNSYRKNSFFETNIKGTGSFPYSILCSLDLSDVAKLTPKILSTMLDNHKCIACIPMGKMIAKKKAFPCRDYPISFHMAYIEISPIMRFLFFYFFVQYDYSNNRSWCIFAPFISHL